MCKNETTFTIWPMFYFVPWNALLLILATSSFTKWNRMIWQIRVQKFSNKFCCFRLSFLSYLVILTVLDSKRTTCIFQEKRYAAKYHSHFLNFYRRMVHIVMYNWWSNRKYFENWIFLLLITTCIKVATNRKLC